MSTPTFVDVFGTPGGLSLGFELAKFEGLAVIDSDKYGLMTYGRNFKNALKIDSNVLFMTEDKLEPILSLKKKIDVVIGGPPCQGFSVVGRVKRTSLVRELKKDRVISARFVDDPRNTLYREFVRIVKLLSPKYFVMENVQGLASYKNGKITARIVDDFKQIGFKTDFQILNAVDFGVPQKRKRIFFVGNRLGLNNPFPKPLSHPDADSNQGNFETVENAIEDLPELNAGEGINECQYDKPPSKRYQKWARRGSKSVFNHIARKHNDNDLRLFKEMKQGQKWSQLSADLKSMYGYRDDIFDDKMKRLEWNKPSWTVVSHLAKDGYLYIHPTQARSITVREAARLQSFPDKFIFEGPRTSQFHQVGRAVPPLLAKAVATAVRKQIR